MAMRWLAGATTRRICKDRLSVTLLLQEMLPRGRGQAQLLMQYQHGAMARTAAGGRFGGCNSECVALCADLLFTGRGVI
jgi:hypothetical protein